MAQKYCYNKAKVCVVRLCVCPMKKNVGSVNTGEDGASMRVLMGVGGWNSLISKTLAHYSFSLKFLLIL